MSWLYSQALVEEYLGDNSLDGEQSVQLNGSHTQLAYLPPDKMTEFSRLSRSGMMFKPLTDDLGGAVLMSYLAGFHAKTSASPAMAQESAANAPGCGQKWRASLAKFDPVSHSWKTAQLCLLGDSESSSVTWPRSGMTAGGECWELPMLAPLTSERGFGSSPKIWPTPTVCGNYNRKGASKHSGDGLATAVMRYATPTARDWRIHSLHTLLLF